MIAAGVLYAHHAALLAIPALVPAVVVVSVVRAFEDEPSTDDHDRPGKA